MATERTLSILKPDTIEKNKAGEALAIIEATGLRPVAARMVHLTRKQAEGFYYVHRERKFFGELVDFMTRGPVLVLVLEGDNAIARYREVMGATDPAKAAEGTIRKRLGANVGENACHGSDAPETAKFEIGYFFPGFEVG
ncbi:MAG: nucleoside-diphosphate kinase [Myxococcales bacterium]|nr:nucleoside-diphosphate kinase [Myxococcales bacterium]MBL8721225.1 nucleoside-diphosphate kinase [Myxococcales bacterium]